MSFIDIKNIWQEYGDHVVLERINLQVKEGEFCSMVGASGCGKSTFLRLLLGQEQPTRGAILLDGQPLAAEPDRSRGVVFQRYSVFPHLSVLDNVTVGLELPSSPCFGRLFGARKRAAREQAAQMLDKVGLAHALDRYPAQLSGGMQQRTAICRMLISQPEVLLLDEPSSSMDHQSEEGLKQRLRGFASHKTVILVTHRTSLLDLVDRLIVLDQGQIVADGPKEAVIDALRKGRVGSAAV